MNLPPIFFYALGTLLIVFGTLRTVVLGRRRADREIVDDTPDHAKARKRHLKWGIIWVLLGLFLVVSTALHH
jgi:hypothetical protein